MRRPRPHSVGINPLLGRTGRTLKMETTRNGNQPCRQSCWNNLSEPYGVSAAGFMDEELV